MNDSMMLAKRSDNWRATKALRSVAAGVTYFTMLFGVGVLLTCGSAIWLEPRCGAASALAIELTIILPAAWLMNRFVAWYFEITAVWPMGAIMAGTTVMLLVVADFALLMLLGTVAAKTIMNHGWMEARFVAQVLMGMLPLLYPRR